MNDLKPSAYILSFQALDTSREVSAAGGLSARGRRAIQRPGRTNKPMTWIHTTSFETRPSAQSLALTPPKPHVTVECSLK